MNQRVIGTILGRAGYEVAIVGDGQQAVDYLSSERCDLVLMDCQMPEMDGFDATRAVRRREAAAADGARTPIVALTANAFAEQRARTALKETGLPIGRILHPSPASPVANRGWAAQAERQLTALGVPPPGH